MGLHKRFTGGSTPIILLLYITFATSLPTSIVMWQRYDDALFIKLGRHIANGEWLGPYNELTLVKGPTFPMFLALVSSTGIPFGIAQYLFLFCSAFYTASILTEILKGGQYVKVALFVGCLICPAIFMLNRVTREFFYIALTILLFGGTLRMLFLSAGRVRDFAAAFAVGILMGLYWITREEGIWLVPSFAILLCARIIRPKASDIVLQLKSLSWVFVSFAAGVLITIAIIGGLNKVYYGRFVIVEMKDSAFQRAMVALQRVGGTYERSYLPVPKEAREAIYAVSPSFALLRPYLDPHDGKNQFEVACQLVKHQTCGDLPGGWFLWALRDAASHAGMYRSADTAANYYESLAAEVELACSRKQLKCISWLPPNIPPITRSQWRAFPDALLRSVMLIVYIPPASFGSDPSSLQTPDSADAVEFLNRPFGIQLLGSKGTETNVRAFIAKSWKSLLFEACFIYRLFIIAGLIAAVATTIVRPSTIFDSAFLIALAMSVAGLSRSVLLALVDISSFPTIYLVRFAPASPLVIMAAVLFVFISMRLLYYSKRSALALETQKVPAEPIGPQG